MINQMDLKPRLRADRLPLMLDNRGEICHLAVVYEPLPIQYPGGFRAVVKLLERARGE